MVTNNKLYEQIHPKHIISLLEFITADDPVLSVPEYFVKYIPDDTLNIVSNAIKGSSQVMGRYPIKQIKRDLFNFTKQFADSILDIKRVDKINRCKNSPHYGFSTYVELDIKKPNDNKLSDFVESNKNKYENITIRFSEHTELRPDDVHESRLYPEPQVSVEYNNKSFNEVASEAVDKLKKYIHDLEVEERDYLNGKNESIKLRIKE